MCNCSKKSFIAPNSQQIYAGAIGLSKLALSKGGIIKDNSDQDTISARLDICRNCIHSTKNNDRLNRSSKGLTTFSQCGKCSCIIALKVQLKSSSCPLELW